MNPSKPSEDLPSAPEPLVRDAPSDRSPAALPTLALIPAGGVGARLGAAQPKQYLPVAGPMTMLEASARALLKAPWIAQVLIVVAPDDRAHAPVLQVLQRDHGSRVQALTEGGATRRDTVLAGLLHLLRGHPDWAPAWVLVHDAARPGLQAGDLERLREAVLADAGRGGDPSGGLLALPITDTVKSRSTGAAGEGIDWEAPARSASTLDRRLLWAAQTPQMFPLGALAQALQAGRDVTDEASAMEMTGVRPLLVEGSRGNLKVTTAEDLQWMRQWLSRSVAWPGMAE